MRFLIIDDDETVHMYLTKLLSPYARCEAVFNGKEAIDRYKEAYEAKDPFDTVFMDILMPEMDGHEVTQKLRDLEKELQVDGPEEFKLVMITSLKDTKNVSQAFFKGYASCYIVKPFNKVQVMSELRENSIL
ncbi:response regulator [Maridesulfovibrio hydrothermalis]|uniref:Response regulator receiver protein n=1 Tax=Maridesulfovibrio hydrothermalis AM13 = DSM 14728 TaxID=1121451 RepID=L0RFI5_9BACT|nr:response regulator [Maridesulfovibrio hydrothermalis]CCO24945.1 Response regulator receiver protein [Maridesulfovibrio hydrothermalis AM13 = DSM 14728]